MFLPKRLFKDLVPPGNGDVQHAYDVNDAPLPFLRHLYAAVAPARGLDVRMHANGEDGYPLIRAVHASHIPLVRFLLGKGAEPDLKDALAIRIAIRKRNLSLVTMLIERDGEDESYESLGHMQTSGRKRKTSAKRPRLSDRVQVTNTMLKLAVEVDARDIVEYLMDKGARPDMQTLQRMQRSRLF